MSDKEEARAKLIDSLQTDSELKEIVDDLLGKNVVDKVIENHNLVKKTCKDHGLTYTQLGELVGYSGETLKNVASKNDASEPLQKAIKLYLKTVEQEKELQKFNDFKKMIKEIVS